MQYALAIAIVGASIRLPYLQPKPLPTPEHAICTSDDWVLKPSSLVGMVNTSARSTADLTKTPNQVRIISGWIRSPAAILSIKERNFGPQFL